MRRRWTDSNSPPALQGDGGLWNVFGSREPALAWGPDAVVGNDPHFGGRGGPSSGENFHAAPNMDHAQAFVKAGYTRWLRHLQHDIGFCGWRLDFAKGYGGEHVRAYIEATEPSFSVGEFWDSLSYDGDGAPSHNQDAHRQRIVDWIKATGGLSTAFDVTSKGILHAVFERGDFWRLSDRHGKPPGLVGWWPSRAVTFIENHDTGSTQGHWRFPRGAEEAVSATPKRTRKRSAAGRLRTD